MAVGVRPDKALEAVGHDHQEAVRGQAEDLWEAEHAPHVEVACNSATILPPDFPKELLYRLAPMRP